MFSFLPFRPFLPFAVWWLITLGWGFSQWEAVQEVCGAVVARESGAASVDRCTPLPPPPSFIPLLHDPLPTPLTNLFSDSLLHDPPFTYPHSSAVPICIRENNNAPWSLLLLDPSLNVTYS